MKNSEHQQTTRLQEQALQAAVLAVAEKVTGVIEAYNSLVDESLAIGLPDSSIQSLKTPIEVLTATFLKEFPHPAHPAGAVVIDFAMYRLTHQEAPALT